MHKLLITLGILLSSAVGTAGQACANDGSEVFGVQSPNARSGSIDGNTQSGYILLGDQAGYEVTCCGVVNRWQAVIRLDGGVAQDIYFQVWRPTAGAYQLVGENFFTPNKSEEQVFMPGAGQQISVQVGDRFGWYSPGKNLIEHKNTGLSATYNVKTFATKPAVGALETWSGTSESGDDRDYAIRMDVDGGNPPVISSPPNGAVYFVTNDSPVGTYVTTLEYSDLDLGDVVTLTPPTTNQFDFDATSGDVTVDVAALDYNLSPEVMTFTVTDFCGNTDTSTITIHTLNDPPVIYGLPQAYSVSEDETVGILLHAIVANDSAPLDEFTCSFTAAVDPNWPFTVKIIPGTFSYGIYLDTDPALDYRTRSEYVLPVTCTDEWGAVSKPENFYVYIEKNKAPQITNLQAGTVVSTTAVIGTVVYVVTSADPEDDPLTYTIICDPPDCPFIIYDTGEIVLTMDISLYSTTGYDINVTVSDPKYAGKPSILSVLIKDINDPVIITNLPSGVSTAIPENAALGTSVFHVSHSDADTQTWTYSMTSTPSLGISYFTIDPDTGLISTSGTVPNFEEMSSTSFTLTVNVNDGTVSDTALLDVSIIDVNEPPTFSQRTYSISATEGPAGLVLGTPSFALSDPDAEDTLTYTLDCGADTGFFFMDPVSGQLNYQSEYDTDVGRPTFVTCSVTVTDSNGLTDIATLYIFISDYNDHTPFFSPASYQQHVSYYATAGTLITTVTAADDDTGGYGTLTYTLDQSSLPAAYFSVDGQGDIRLVQSPEGLESATTYTIYVTASDMGGLSATAPVLVTVGDMTTTITTTTTDRYRTFIEDGRNIAWLVAASVLLALIIAGLVWLIYTSSGGGTCAYYFRNLCQRQRNRRPRLQYRPPPSPPSYRRPAELTTVRHAPPPIRQQQWRTGVNVPGIGN